MSLTGRGVLDARVFVQPKGQRMPIQIINPGVEPVKLYKRMKVGDLQQVDVEMKDPVSNIYASSSGEFGLTSLAEQKIETREATPIKQLPRRLPNAL